MCGISAIAGNNWSPEQLERMVISQQHRGPDASNTYIFSDGRLGLGHNRLSIIDLTNAATQPMCTKDQQLWVIFNGEIYNYLELRSELSEYNFETQSDTEVILAAYRRWGKACFEHFIGMFSIIIWDEEKQQLICARDRFGVKPLYYHLSNDGTLFLSSEIKAIHAAGIPRDPDESTWATYLAYGAYDHSADTFWEGIHSIPAGHLLIWHKEHMQLVHWYDLRDKIGPIDERKLEEIQDEYLALLENNVLLRFRSDVPVGVNLSGGLDSSLLLGLIHRVQGDTSSVRAYTFATGDERYDETSWVASMVAHTNHESVICLLNAYEVPELAESVQRHQDEPFGGIPTLAYAKIFEIARQRGDIVLLDGQGMDEQWAGYDYYLHQNSGSISTSVQGTKDSPVKPLTLTESFLQLAQKPAYPKPFTDSVLNLQYRDIVHTKIPRSLRFNDRISMRSSTELREPFLDHRLFELALRQPLSHKIVGQQQKWFPRQLAQKILPRNVTEAPKRALQTPQREWLRGPLKNWANDCIHLALRSYGGTWLKPDIVISEWDSYLKGNSDNSFYIWQWINLGLVHSVGNLS